MHNLSQLVEKCCIKILISHKIQCLMQLERLEAGCWMLEVPSVDIQLKVFTY